MDTLTLILILNTLFIGFVALGAIGYVLSRPQGRRSLRYVVEKIQREPVLVANSVAFVVNLMVITNTIPVEMSQRLEIEIIAGVTLVANLIARYFVTPTTGGESRGR